MLGLWLAEGAGALVAVTSTGGSGRTQTRTTVDALWRRAHRKISLSCFIHILTKPVASRPPTNTPFTSRPWAPSSHYITAPWGGLLESCAQTHR